MRHESVQQSRPKLAASSASAPATQQWVTAAPQCYREVMRNATTRSHFLLLLQATQCDAQPRTERSRGNPRTADWHEQFIAGGKAVPTRPCMPAHRAAERARPVPAMHAGSSKRGGTHTLSPPLDPARQMPPQLEGRGAPASSACKASQDLPCMATTAGW